MAFPTEFAAVVRAPWSGRDLAQASNSMLCNRSASSGPRGPDYGLNSSDFDFCRKRQEWLVGLSLVLAHASG